MVIGVTQFKAAISELTKPLNGQLPRPWMTDLSQPESAELFIVGRNQRNGYSTAVLTHERHLDALFNRNGESCRGVYEELTQGRASPTRQHTDQLRLMLQAEGVRSVLETNVICYSTPMSSDLRLPENQGGTVRGSEIFSTLLAFIKPRVIIVHGQGARKKLSRLLGAELPELPDQDEKPESIAVNGAEIFPIPSLAPPRWNGWQNWAPTYLPRVAKAVGNVL